MNKELKKIKFCYESTKAIRIDKFLAQKLEKQGYSRAFLSILIKEGQVKINNEICLSPKKLLKYDDQIEVQLTTKNQDANIVANKIDIPIVYEDEDIIVVDKPNNLVVHPGAGNWDNTLVNGLLFNFQELSLVDSTRPGIIHRLDKQTTGLLIVAKNNQSHYFLAEELKQRKIKREYIALVHGIINNKSGTIDAPIARDSHNRLKMTVSENKNAKKAITHFIVLERFAGYTLIACQLETGRTHQIRVHLQWINHPIVNDPLYSNYPVENSNLGQYLHASQISFIHPRTKKSMIFKSELPEFFKNRLQLLRKESGD